MVAISLSMVIRDGGHLLLVLLAGCVLSINWPFRPVLGVFSCLFVQTLKKKSTQGSKGDIWAHSSRYGQSTMEGKPRHWKLEVDAQTLPTVKEQRQMDA